MSVIIKDMEMPGCCAKCILSEDVYVRMPSFEIPIGTKCRKLDRMCADPEAERENDCPLNYVPPHGDLIDRDKLCELCDLMADKCGDSSLWKQFRNVAEDSPTIIEASKG